VRVDRVGLAALAGGEHPHPGRQFRWHVEHRFAVGDQPLRDVPADAVAALDCPDPLRVAPAGGEHRPVAVPVGTEPATRQDHLPTVDDLDRRRPLVRIHPDDDAPHVCLLAVSERVQREGSATLSWAVPSGATPRHGDRRDACQMRATPQPQTGSRE
jgi:hypothetical protein